MVALARGLYFCATLLLFGICAFTFLLRGRLPIIVPLRDTLLRWILLVLALLSGCAWLGLAAAAMADAMDRQAVMTTATDTLFGQFFLARMMALAGIGLLLVLRRGQGKSGLVVLLSALALVLPSATSHASAASPAGFAAIGAITDAVHLLTAGFWIGGLAVLLLLFRRHEPNMLLVLSLFSDWAMGAVLLLVMTGLINGASILLGQEGKPSAFYLAALGAKLALVAGMIGLAIINRFRLMPRGTQSSIARHAAIELGAGMAVVLIAGLLGQIAPLQ